MVHPAAAGPSPSDANTQRLRGIGTCLLGNLQRIKAIYWTGIQKIVIYSCRFQILVNRELWIKEMDIWMEICMSSPFTELFNLDSFLFVCLFLWHVLNHYMTTIIKASSPTIQVQHLQEQVKHIQYQPNIQSFL